MFTNISRLLRTSRLFLLANLRSPDALFFGFAFPIIFTAIFAFIGQGFGSYTVLLEPDSITEGIVYETLQEIEVIDLDESKNQEEIDDSLNKGQAPASISIRQDGQLFVVDLTTSEAAPQEAQVVESIIGQTISSINQSALSSIAPPLVDLTTNSVSGRAYEAVDFILPGQLSFALLGTAVFGISYSFVTLRKTLVLKRMAATSSPRWVILGAKVLANVVIATLQAGVIIAVGYFFFDFTLVNGWITVFQMLLLSVFGLLVFLSFGLLVSSVARNEEAASPLANIITLPQFILSGSFFSVDVFPDWLRNIAELLPMTFLNDALRIVSFEGGSLDAVLPEILGLVVWAIIIYIPALYLFKWE
jgi:ABC-2 type transport system permease protein